MHPGSLFLPAELSAKGRICVPYMPPLAYTLPCACHGWLAQEPVREEPRAPAEDLQPTEPGPPRRLRLRRHHDQRPVGLALLALPLRSRLPLAFKCVATGLVGRPLRPAPAVSPERVPRDHLLGAVRTHSRRGPCPHARLP